MSSNSSSTKKLPNIIICGTPAVGKTRIAKELCQSNPSLTYININDLAKENDFLLEYDQQNECHILDDDAIAEFIENRYFDDDKSPSGLVFDYVSAEIVPESDEIHAVFVVRCSNEILYDRLAQRNYSQNKIEQNIQSEIFQVCLDEAQDVFDPSLVHQLNNETEQDLQKNIETLRQWIEQWKEN